MAETRYYAEYLLTGHTQLLIENGIYLNIVSGYTGLGKSPLTRLDVQGQIRLNTGSTNLEGEIRYKDQLLWLNTGGTADDWVSLNTSNQFSGATDPDFWYDSPNDTLYDPRIKLTSTTGWTTHAASYWPLYIDRSDGAVYASSGGTIGSYWSENSSEKYLYPTDILNSVMIGGDGTQDLWISVGSVTPVLQITGSTFMGGYGVGHGIAFLENRKSDFYPSVTFDHHFDDNNFGIPREDTTIANIEYWYYYNTTGHSNASVIKTQTSRDWVGGATGFRGIDFIISTNNGSVTSSAMKDRIHIDASGHTNIENGALILDGSFATPIEIRNSSKSLTDVDGTLIMSGNTNITLPLARDYPGRIFVIKRFSSGSHDCTIQCSGSDDLGITSALTPTFAGIGTDGYSVTFQSDGINRWHLIQSSTRVT